jgi:transcriptional regulator with XRE-family HTH domain
VFGVLIELDVARVDVRIEWVGGRRVPTLVLDDGSAIVTMPAAGRVARARTATLISRALADLQSGGFGRRLRELCRARGLSGPMVAQRANYSRNYLWELASGRKLPSVDVAEVLDGLLDAGGELLALATGGQPPGEIGEVRAGGARLLVSASDASSLVTLRVDVSASGESATLAGLRELALTGRTRVDVCLNGGQVAELVRLLRKAVSASEPSVGEAP